VGLLLRNRERVSGIEGGRPRAVEPLRWLSHLINGGSEGRRARASAARHDLGNVSPGRMLEATPASRCSACPTPTTTRHDERFARVDAIGRGPGLNPAH
jgi:hypothetical protein